MYDGIKTEFVTSTVNAQFEVFRKTIGLDSMSDHCEIFIKLFFKLIQIPYIIHPLVETPGELWCDGLGRDALIGHRSQNNEKFMRSLGAVSFIHRNFSDELIMLQSVDDVLIDIGGFLNRLKVFAGDSENLFSIHLKRCLQAFDGART